MKLFQHLVDLLRNLRLVWTVLLRLRLVDLLPQIMMLPPSCLTVVMMVVDVEDSSSAVPPNQFLWMMGLSGQILLPL